MTTGTAPLRAWTPIIGRARALVAAFNLAWGRPPTLRRLHYELVSDAAATSYGYRNTQQDYKRLSALTAEGRRDGSFPDLDEVGRNVSKQQFFDDADELRAHVRSIAKVDRMDGQEYSVCMVVEKVGSRQFLVDWFNDYGVLIHALGGYDSQTQVDIIRRWQRADGRPMKLFYAGDHDATGEDIDRDFQSRLLNDGDADIEVQRVALLPEQVDTYGLPRSPFEKDDSRAESFIRRHGGLWQTELDAMAPDTLRTLYQEALDGVWDDDVFEARKAEEADLLREVLGDYAEAEDDETGA